MAERITEKKLKHWLETDNLFTIGLFKLDIHSGYYHIRNEYGENVIVEKTAGQCWESWKYFKAGFYFAKSKFGFSEN